MQQTQTAKQRRSHHHRIAYSGRRQKYWIAWVLAAPEIGRAHV